MIHAKAIVKVIEGLFQIPCVAAEEAKDFIIVLDERSVEPTEDELKMLVSYREYLVNRSYCDPARILAMDLPAIEGHDTTIFLKADKSRPHGEFGVCYDGWCYRKATWEGPFFSPCSAKEPMAWPLELLLDRIEQDSRDWKLWKHADSEIFHS